MTQRDTVLVLTLLGSALTVGGVLLGYGRALVAKRRQDRLGVFNRSMGEDSLDDAWALGKSGTESEIHEAQEARRRRDELVAAAVSEAGFEEGAPTFADLRLPITYWSRRGALKEALDDFWIGGTIALVGVLVSTAAATWSLYLPPA